MKSGKKSSKATKAVKSMLKKLGRSDMPSVKIGGKKKKKG